MSARATKCQNVPSQSSHPAPGPQQSGYPQAYPQHAYPQHAYPQQQSGYPPQQSGYPPQHHPGYPPPQPYPQGPQGYPQQGYSQYPQPQQQYAQAPQGYPQQGYPQPQPYPQQPYPQQQQQQHAPQAQYPSNYQEHGQGHGQAYPHPQTGYPQTAAPQASQASHPPAHHPPAAYAATQAQPVYEPQIQYGAGGEPESGVHPADLEGRTIVRPTFTSKPAASLSPVPAAGAPAVAAPAPAAASALDRTIQGNGASAHNDTVIAVSPFADPFAIARRQSKADPNANANDATLMGNGSMGNGSLAETRVQHVDPTMFAASAPSPQPGLVGNMGTPATPAPQYQQQAYTQMIHQAPPVHQQQQQLAQQTPAYNPAISYAPAPAPAPAARTSPAPAAPAGRMSNMSNALTPSPSPAPTASTGLAPTTKPAENRMKPTLGTGGLSVGMAGVGAVDLSKMNRFAGRFGKGMVPVFGLVAVLVAIVFDAIFLKLPIGGGFISRLWYFTTFISFAAAGYSAAVTTRAGKGFLFTSAVVVAILYGAADVALESVVGGASLVGALILAAQGVVIAIIAGFFAIKKGLSQRAG